MNSEYEMSEEIRSLEQQLDCATEYCRQYQIENNQLKERVKELERQPAQEPVSSNELEELLDEYFDLAFEQGREFACNGVKANRVRKEILGLFQQEPVKQESWISVDERLPEVKAEGCGFFLVTAINLQTQKKSVFEAAFLNEMELYSDDHDPQPFSGWHRAKESKDYDGGYEPLGNEYCKVTHWMPLPPAQVSVNEQLQEKLDRMNGLYHSEVAKHQLDYNALQAEISKLKEAAKYAEHIDATPVNQRETMLYDTLVERDTLQIENVSQAKQLDYEMAKRAEYELEYAVQAKRIAHQQYLIDSLMIEYCPDEITEEQWENWKAHQRKAQNETHIEVYSRIFARNGCFTFVRSCCKFRMVRILLRDDYCRCMGLLQLRKFNLEYYRTCL